MKKLLLAVSLLGLFALGSCVAEECECIFEDLPTCLNDYDLGESCLNDCDWDVLDCNYDCQLDGFVSGYCALDDLYGDYCVCEY
ncbi:hypothetical protein KKF84_03155 [Myxococcota bacterium]|nr:hypothetical protein [Myxococcota bacterium]